MKRCKYCGKKYKNRNLRYCAAKCKYDDYRGKDQRTRSRNHGRHIKTTVNGKTVYFHRLVYEREVRELMPGEIVHHRNENKQDNTRDNLQALSGHSAHTYIHNYIRGAKRRQQTPEEIEQEIADILEFGF